jgi:exonuclease SbcC
MRIVKLQIKNFLSISEAEIAPGSVNQIVGANNQGKTSVLKALEAGLCGSTDGSLVKRGETEAEIIVEFDDQTTVRRRIKADGKQALTVKRGDLTAQQPQAFIDRLFGEGVFNPLELLDPKKRTEILLGAIPIKLSEEKVLAFVGSSPVAMPPLDYAQHGLKVAEQAHKYFYQRRAEANKDAKMKDDIARVKASELPPLPALSLKESEADIQERNFVLKQKIAGEQRKANVQREHEALIERVEEEILREDQAINELKRDIAALEARIFEMRKSIDAKQKAVAEKDNRLAELRAAPAAQGPDQSAIAKWNEEIQAGLEELQRRADRRVLEQRHAQVDELKSTAKNAQKFADDLDAVVTKLSTYGSDLLSKAEMPIAGLEYKDGDFMLDGVKIENLSSSAAVRLAVAIARAVAGPSKLICLDGAEALDETTFAVLRREIQDDGFQYFLTKVGDAFATEADDRVIEMRAGAPVQAEAVV